MQVHLISIKICVIWFRICYIHTECIANIHDYSNMTHHTHSVECRLSIEKNTITIHHVTMNHIAIFQVDVIIFCVSK